MKFIISLILLFIFFSASSSKQTKLTIEITSLRNSKGQILLELKDSNDKKIKGFAQKIVNKKCIIVIDDLKPGKYAFKYFHDEDNNKELETNWIGIPKEGYGFSNNATGTFGPPSFEDMLFELNLTLTQKCTPTYH